jgi:hypothetical protein
MPITGPRRRWEVRKYKQWTSPTVIHKFVDSKLKWRKHDESTDK